MELTESLLLENVEETIQKMIELKALGIRFAMDDFGTGYSSLSYLAQLPLDQLKIDRSFVHNLAQADEFEGNNETIVRTIINMGRALNMNVIAEGVETDVQREFLETNGCETFQGYLFSEPVNLMELEEMFTTH